MAKIKNKSSKTILVTGGVGFIGSNYLNKYVRRYPKYYFVVIDRLTDAGSKKNIEVWGAPNFAFVKGDIRNKKTLTSVFKKYAPTHVIHFAAETHVDKSIVDPHIFEETNVRGTTNLLSLAHENGIQRFLHISTDEVYGALGMTERAFKETDTFMPNSPYSASKASAEHFVRAFNKTYGLETVVTRCSNNYGPRQDSTKFIPVCINKILHGEKIPLYGNGMNIRDWIYVEDHVDAIDLVFHSGKSGEVYNVSGNHELKNIDVVKKLLRLTGSSDALISFVKDRPGHDFRYALSSKKIQKELGFKPKISFAEGLKKTLEYYANRADQRSAKR